MSHNGYKRSVVSAFLRLALLIYASPSLMAGYWDSQPHTFSGSRSAKVECPLYSWHRVSIDEPWLSANSGASAETYACCTKGMVFSGGSITHSFVWVGTGAHDWTLLKEWTFTSHRLDDLAAGYAWSTIGPSNSGWYTIRYVWVPSSSGTIVRNYRVGARVDFGTGTHEGSVGTVAHNPDAIWTGANIDWSKLPEGVTTADRTYVELPGRSSSQPYTRPPCYNHRTSAANSGDDPINLATGEHLYVTEPDINVYNPNGPAVVYQRNCLSRLVKDNVSSPGLTVGWVDGFDAKFVALSPETWGNLKLVYPNTSEEGEFAPAFEGQDPNGQFAEPTGCEFMLEGDPSSTTGQWDSLTITFKDRFRWQFARVSADTYMLSAIVNQMGKGIVFERDAANRVLTVKDNESTQTTLLTFGYTNGLLSSLTDAYGRRINYGYQDFSGVTCLRTMSQISTGTSAPMAVQYGYDLLGSPTARPHLTSVAIPSPTGSGTSTESFTYNADLQVESMTDANGNTHSFSYESPDATRVEVKNPSGALKERYLQIFDTQTGHHNRSLGRSDDSGSNVAIEYGDSSNPDLPTKLVNAVGKATEVTYDQYGNVLTATNARGTVTSFTYHYTIFPLGRLTQVDPSSNLLSSNELKKPVTTIAYYNLTDYRDGLIYSVTYPKPGTTGPNGDTVTTYYDYDVLGNITSVDAPGNNAVSRIVTRYDYGATPKLGQPLTITTNYASPRYFQYDSRGNLTSAKDALNNETNATYNLADQPLAVIYPSTSE